MDKKQQQITQSHLKFINTLLTNSISLNWWKTAHFMVFNDKTNQFLHRTQNVHIEADYNAILKIKWSKALHQAERESIVHPLQFRS
jgi:hypothetical protein